MTHSHLLEHNRDCVASHRGQLFFNVSLLSHTQDDCSNTDKVTHTPNHNSESADSQANKHLCQQTHTHTTPRRGRLEKFPSAWVTFRPFVCHLCHVSCSQALSSQKLCLLWGRRSDLMTNLLFVVQQKLEWFFWRLWCFHSFPLSFFFFLHIQPYITCCHSL